MTSRIWYVVAGGFIATAGAIAMIGFTAMISTVEGMYRVAMPGRAEVVLPAGPSTFYAETRSKLDGKVYEGNGSSGSRCELTSPQGQAIAIAPSASSVTYAIAGYAGHSAFDVDIASAGTHVLACESRDPFVMAVGRGVGTWIVIAVVAIVPALGGVATVIIVFLRRRRQRRSMGRVTSTA